MRAPQRYVLPVMVFLTLPVSAVTRYVDVNSAAPLPPYTNWATAANVLQDAVDAASLGDTVLVTNGVYATGGKAVSGFMTNRVAVDKALAVQSVNGPAVTFIRGYQTAGTTNGFGAVRCVLLADGASLTGFTLTNGATRTSGSTVSELYGGGLWCNSSNAWASNCVVTGNSAARNGGAAYSGTFYNCTFANNSAWLSGGGALASTLVNCSLTGNSAERGGGAYASTLANCNVTGNSATIEGGGTHSSTLRNCIVFFNSAGSAGDNYHTSSLDYCCTTPMPATGVSNLTENPLLASASHLSDGSPCRGAGNIIYALGFDIDSEPWMMPPSIGCDEYWSGSATGPLSVLALASHTNVAAGFTVDFTAKIDGQVVASTWDFGDGIVASNQPYVSHAWTNEGDYSVFIKAYNETWPSGVTATVLVHVVDNPIHYVAANGNNPVPPYSSWGSAATNIQAAVDAAFHGGTVLVTNGVYANGGKAIHGTLTNRVALDKAVTLLSVNGPEHTFIVGAKAITVPGFGNGAIRCVYLANGASIAGFSITNGATLDSSTLELGNGGGVFCESTGALISNCVISANTARQGGGGVISGTLTDCVISNNLATIGGGGVYLSHCSNSQIIANTATRNSGGGADGATLRECQIVGNNAGLGAGCFDCALTNCVVLNNSALFTGGGVRGGTVVNSLILSNTAPNDGGGTYETTVLDSLIAFNTTDGTGGGAYHGQIVGSTVVNNSAGTSGGGIAAMSTTEIRNSIFYFNSAPIGSNYTSGLMSYSCTLPPPPTGPGNITNAPLFMNEAGGDFRLQSNSPCINAGNNASVTSSTDLDDNPRIAGGTVDLGAYEFESPTSVISYAWLQQYGLPTDGSVDHSDLDNDEADTWTEWKTWTNPTNELSVLRMLSAQPGPAGTLVTWRSVSGHSYLLERATNPAAGFSLVEVNIPGQVDTTSFLDAAATNASFFYRAGASY